MGAYLMSPPIPTMTTIEFSGILCKHGFTESGPCPTCNSDDIRQLKTEVERLRNIIDTDEFKPLSSEKLDELAELIRRS